MTLKNIFHSFHSSYRDLHRAFVFVIPTLMLVVLQHMHPLTFHELFWAGITILLSGLGLVGENKRQQFLKLLQFYGLALIATLINSLIYFKIGVDYYPLWLFACIFLLLTASHLERRNRSAIVVLVCVYIILIPSLPVIENNSISLITMSVLKGISLGTILLMIVLAALPFAAKPFIQNQQLFSHQIVRNAKIALGVSLAYAMSHYFQLQHPSWSAVSALVVSQGTLGATVRRANQRVLGTIGGVILGAPLALFIFAPFPIARYLVLVILGLGFFEIGRSYAKAMFYFTLGLGAVYFVIKPNGGSEVLFFIGERLVETLLGAGLLILIETLLLPKSIIECIKLAHYRYWLMTSRFLANTSDQEQAEKIEQALANLRDQIMDYSYEPAVLLSGQYHYLLKIHVLIEQLFQTLKGSAFFTENPAQAKIFAEFFEQFSVEVFLPYAERIPYLLRMRRHLKNLACHESLQLITIIEKIIRCKRVMLRQKLKKITVFSSQH